MNMESFWKKHANDSDWDSRYIDMDRAAAVSDFTQTVVGTGTATFGPTGLVLVNSAGASDSIQYQYTVPQIQAKAPKVGSILKPSSYPYEMEFIFAGSIASPASIQGALGFYGASAAILPSHQDAIGLASPAAAATIGLDLYASGVNQITNYPSGGPRPSAFSYLPTDGLSHEIAFQATPLAGAGTSGEMKVWVDGEMVADFGIGDQLYWVGLTQAVLAPSFAFGNSSGALTAAQRTVTVQRVGWAFRR